MATVSGMAKSQSDALISQMSNVNQKVNIC